MVLLTVAPGVGQVGEPAVQDHPPGGDAWDGPGLGQIGDFLGDLLGG